MTGLASFERNSDVPPDQEDGRWGWGGVVKSLTRVWANPVCYSKSCITDRGHGIHRGTAGVCSVGLRFVWLERLTTSHYWPLLVDQGITGSCQLWSSTLRTVPCSCEMSATSSVFTHFFPLLSVQAKSCSGEAMCETWPWSVCVSSTTTAG